jgi:hypothetical protein
MKPKVIKTVKETYNLEDFNTMIISGKSLIKDGLFPKIEYNLGSKCSDSYYNDYYNTYHVKTVTLTYNYSSE